jgi:hypothetical protein
MVTRAERFVCSLSDANFVSARTHHSPTVDSFRPTLALQIKSSSQQLCSPMHIQEKTYLSRSGHDETASGVEMVAEHVLYRCEPLRCCQLSQAACATQYALDCSVSVMLLIWNANSWY